MPIWYFTLMFKFMWYYYTFIFHSHLHQPMPEWRDLRSSWHLHLWWGLDWNAVWNRYAQKLSAPEYSKGQNSDRLQYLIHTKPTLTLTHMLFHSGLTSSFEASLFIILFPLLYSLAINCGDPGTLANGQRSLSSTIYNSVVTYTCDVGYTLQGSDSRTCQLDGWTGSLPQCQRMLNGCNILVFG